MPKARTIEDREILRKRQARRKMAWTALVSMIVCIFGMMFLVSIDRIQILSGLLETFFFCMASIVLGYCGFATFFDVTALRKGKSPPPAAPAASEEETDPEETEEKR